MIYSPLNSGPLSSIFPFTSADLTSNDGIMYGVNRHNNTLIIFDRFSPENEYQNLASAIGGSFFKISLASDHHINPFEIPIIPEDEDPSDVLRSHIVNLTGLLKIMLGQITPEEDAILDRALSETYASHDIVPGKDFSSAVPPLLEDLQKIL